MVLVASGCAGLSSPVGTAATSGGEMPPPVRQVLPNGLRLIVQDHRAADIVAVYLYVGVGVRYERPDQLGYSHFQEHMLFKGTDKWGPGYIDRAVEGVGGRTNATTSFDYTDFYIVVPTEATEMAVQTLADMVFRSKFDPAEVARERDVIFEEANIETDNPKAAIVRQLYGLVYAGNPYGSPLLGTRPTMSAATSEILKAYNKQYYTPENMALVVAGPVEVKAVRAMVDRIWGVIPATGYKPVPAPEPRRLSGVVRRTVERPEQQARLALGWQAPRADDLSGDAVDLLTTILAGAESSRLARRLRDQERLVSSITMSYSAQMGGGIVTLRAELEAKDLERVEQIILEEIARMQEGGPTEEERQLAVIQFESQHAFDTETSEGLANAYALAETTWTLEAELRLHGPPRQDHARADPRRGAPLSLAHRLRADRLPAQAMSRRPVAAVLLLGCAALGLLAGLAGAADSATGAVTRARLANGMVVLVRENPTAPVVGMSLMLRMGTRWETRETAGLSNFLQLMVVRGTTSRDGTQIVSAADRMGGSIDAYADADYAEIAATALSRFWGDMLDLVAEVALQPSLTDGTTQAVRDFLVRQIRNRADKPYDAAFDVSDGPDVRKQPVRVGRRRAQGERRANGSRRAPGPLPASLRSGRDGAGDQRQGEESGGRRQGRTSLRRAPGGRGAGPQCDAGARACCRSGSPDRAGRPGADPHGWTGAFSDRSRPGGHEAGEHRAGGRAVQPLFLRAPRQAGAGLHNCSPGALARGRRLFPRPARYGAGQQGQGRGGAP